jgi:hypothetical protein
MDALLETLALGLTARNFVAQARPDHEVGTSDLSESDADFRDLADLLGRPLESWEAFELFQLDAWDRLAKDLIEAVAGQSAPEAERRADFRTSELRDQLDRAEMAVTDASDRAKLAEREVDSLRGDVAWLKRELCRKAGPTSAETTPSALLALRERTMRAERDAREADGEQSELRMAISALDRRLFAQATGIRADLSRGVGKRLPYQTKKAADIGESRAQILEYVSQLLTKIHTPKHAARRAA